MVPSTDGPVSLQPKSTLSSVTQVPVIQQQPERPNEFGDSGTMSGQNVMFPSKQEISKKSLLVRAPAKNIVPTIDAQSSSLMEGSGEFDPSDLSNSNFLSHNLSEMSNLEIIRNQEADKAQAKLPKDFEPTNLLVNIDNEHIQVNIGIVLAQRRAP